MPHLPPEPDPAAAQVAWDQRNARLAELIHRAQAGEVAAFDELYDSTAAWLLACIRRRVRDGSEEDVLAEVFLKVWRSLGAFDARRAPAGAWLLLIARSIAIDHLRRQSTREASDRHASLSGRDEPAAHSEGPEELCACSQQRTLVRRSLESLSENEQRVIRLAYFEDCNRQEIADRTALCPGVVAALMRSGQSKLRALLVVSLREPGRRWRLADWPEAAGRSRDG